VGRRGVGRVEGEGVWVNDALKRRRPSCVYSGPDRCPQQPRPYHEENGRRVEQFGTTGYPINAPQWPTGPELVQHGFIGLAKSCL